MIDLLQISSEAVPHIVEAGAHAVASANPIETIATGFHVEVSRLIAQIVALLIVFGLLRWKAWGPITKILDERREKIADGLQYAEEMKGKLADAERKQSETIKEAALEAKQITADAQKTAKEIVEKTTADAQRRAEEIVTQTREALSLERNQMMAEIKEHAAHLVTLTTAKILSRELSDAEKASYAEKAVQELSK